MRIPSLYVSVLNSLRRTAFLVRKPSFVYNPPKRSSFHHLNFDEDTTSTGSSLTAELPVDSASHLQLCTNPGSLIPREVRHTCRCGGPDTTHPICRTQSTPQTRGQFSKLLFVQLIAMTNISLLGLTDVGNDERGATEVVKYLLQAVGRDIVSLQRNTHVSYMVTERARDIVKAINECIINVENSATGDWESYEKFSEAIEPLEE